MLSPLQYAVFKILVSAPIGVLATLAATGHVSWTVFSALLVAMVGAAFLADKHLRPASQ